MVTIYITGKKYKVPAGLSIQKAMEEAGYRLLRGCGCRGGFCGACGTIYRTPNDFKLKVGLACQTVVEEGMRLVQIPYFPANKAYYEVDKLSKDGEHIRALYPEVMRCLQCNTCTKICPQDIKVMDYIASAMQDDVENLAKKSFNCVMCGLCASRCPAELVQYEIAMLGRRLYGKYIAKKAAHLETRVNDIAAGKFDEPLKAMMGKSEDELKELYESRDIEK